MLRLPPPIWAMVFLGAAAAVSWALGWPAIPLPHHAAIGITIFFLGGVLPGWGFRRFRLAQTEIDPVSETNRALITEWPYSFSRNPMYLGVIVIVLGAAIWVGAWPMLLAPAAVFATANFVHIPFEEAKMRRQFGPAYDAYAGRVRRWL